MCSSDLLIRFDQGRPVYYDRYLDWQIVLVVVAIQLTVFALNGFYHRWWRYVSTRDMWGAVRGVTVATLLADLILYAFPPAQERLSRGIAALDYLLLLAFVAGSRLLARSAWCRADLEHIKHRHSFSAHFWHNERIVSDIRQ